MQKCETRFASWLGAETTSTAFCPELLLLATSQPFYALIVVHSGCLRLLVTRPVWLSEVCFSLSPTHSKETEEIEEQHGSPSIVSKVDDITSSSEWEAKSRTIIVHPHQLLVPLRKSSSIFFAHSLDNRIGWKKQLDSADNGN